MEGGRVEILPEDKGGRGRDNTSGKGGIEINTALELKGRELLLGVSLSS